MYIHTSTVNGDKNDSKLGGAFLGLMKIIEIPRINCVKFSVLNIRFILENFGENILDILVFDL